MVPKVRRDVTDADPGAGSELRHFERLRPLRIVRGYDAMHEPAVLLLQLAVVVTLVAEIEVEMPADCLQCRLTIFGRVQFQLFL